jgi:membrane fusion protein, multidrug efflux system
VQTTTICSHRPRPTGPILFALLVAALGSSGCNRPPSSEASEALAAGGVQAREIPKVRECTLERREMVQVLETMTKVESEREIEVFPRSAGIVTTIHAEEGDQVKEGDILAEIDDRDETLAVRDAEVALDETRNSTELTRLTTAEAEARMQRAELTARQAERDHERNRKLFEGEKTSSPLSESALEASLLARDQARHDHNLAVISRNKSRLDEKAGETATSRAEVTLDRARIALSYRRIEAPFDGVIAERRIREGDSANSGAAAFVLSDTNNLRTIIRRPQEELMMFRGSINGHGDVSLEVTATTEALPGHIFPGTVQRISPTIDRDSGQFRITARLGEDEENPGVKLLPGMLVRLAIVTDRHPRALVVPKRALRREGERRFLFLLEEPEKEAEEKPVETDGEGSETESEPTDTSGESGEDPPAAPALAKNTRVLVRVDIEEGFSDEDFVEVIAREEGLLVEGAVVMLVGSRELDDGDLVEVETREALARQDDGTDG